MALTLVTILLPRSRSSSLESNASRLSVSAAEVIQSKERAAKDTGLAASTSPVSLSAVGPINLGDVKTTITHPATTTHGRLSDEERRSSGISDGLVRIAVGVEHFDDIRGDLERGLRSI